jgi:hypothetical protein
MGIRSLMFGASIVTATLSAAAAIVDWAAPFPLVAHSDGSFSLSPWDDRVFAVGLVFCLATTGFAVFGRGRSRWLLISAGPLLSVISVIGYLGNHV